MSPSLESGRPHRRTSKHRYSRGWWGAVARGCGGLARLHALIGERLDEQRLEQEAGEADVVVGSRPIVGCVQALVAAGHSVFAVTRRRSRFWERWVCRGQD